MTLPYNPKRGEVLICDFDTGFKPPEMIKRRPVVVVSTKSYHRESGGLCTVVPLSTTVPNKVSAWHHKINNLIIPSWPETECWAKCDMVATVSYHRLNKPYKKSSRSGGRNYIEVTLLEEDMLEIGKAIKSHFGLA